MAEAEKALASARETLTQLQQEAPSPAVVEASGASGASSSAAYSSLLTSTTAELSSSSDRAEGYLTPPTAPLGPAGEAFTGVQAGQGSAPAAAASADAAAASARQAPRLPGPRRDTDPWYSAERAQWRFPVGPRVAELPADVPKLTGQLHPFPWRTALSGVISPEERIATAWQLGLSDRDFAVHFYNAERRRQEVSPEWLHCTRKSAYVVLALGASPPTILTNYEVYKRRTHPDGLGVRSVSRGFLTLLEARIYLQAVAYLGPVERE